MRLFAHTADVGLDVRGESLEELFGWAAAGLARVAVGRAAPRGLERADAAVGGPLRRVQVSLPAAPDIEALLVDWLNYLVYVLDTERIYPVRCELAVSGGEGGPWTLRGVVEGRPVPPQGGGRTVKAATYHGLELARAGDGLYRARVILDV